MAEVASASMAPSALAFGSSRDRAFLAAGTAPGEGGSCVAVFRAAAADKLEFIASFPSLAPFCRLAWSKPSEATCWSSAFHTGLIAGGLESGAVAVWDPHERFHEGSESDSAIIDNYFVQKETLRHVTNSSPNLVVADIFRAHQENSAAAVPDPQLDEESVPYGGWSSEFNLIDNYFSSERPSPSVRPHGTGNNLVAVLSSHSGPVHGLSFSPQSQQFLASGASNGKVVVWDLINPSAGSMPSFKVWDVRNMDKPLGLLCEDTPGITSLSWSPFREDTVVACTKQKILMLNVKKGEVVFEAEVPETCLDIQWSGDSEDRFALATSDRVRLYEYHDF